MTKTLTEQWREGTLEDRDYYVLRDDEEVVKLTWSVGLFLDTDVPLYGEDEKRIKEVLAPVPSYEEVKEMDDELKELATKNDTLAMENGRLKERLAISTKALKEIEEHTKELSLPSYTGMICHKALKEMEGVK